MEPPATSFDDLDAEKLARLSNPHLTNLGGLLDAIPGAFERAHLGREQAARGETIPLSDL